MSTLPTQLAVDDSQERIASLLADESSISMVFQPIVELETRRVIATEALARFSIDSDRGPQAWFLEASRVGLLGELELMALRKALEAYSVLPDGVRLHMNASPATLTSPELLDVITPDIAHRVVLEVSAEASVSYRLLEKSLQTLRNMGTHLAVDDAGRRTAGLWHLANLRPEVIKLDSSLVRIITEDSSARAVSCGLIAFAEQIGAVVIAEAIETDLERVTLQNLGVKFGQGYLFGHPAPL